jgi:hypothetical protein
MTGASEIARTQTAAEVYPFHLHSARHRKATLLSFPRFSPAAVLEAAAQAFSVKRIREFSASLRQTDPLLFHLGWALLCVVPVFGLLAWFQPIAAATVSPWIKPIKFAISLATFGWTVSFLLSNLKLPNWQQLGARYAVAVSMVGEVLFLAIQAWRTQAQMTGQVDSMMSQLTTGMILISTVVTIWVFALFCRPMERSHITDSAMIAAIRFSLVIFLVGNAIGGYMLGRGSHTVGASDGGPGLPFVNWSTIAGDLRISHFLAIHAIQALPLFAYLLAQWPGLSLRKRKWAVAGASIGFSLIVLGTFVEAAMGRPLMLWRL